VLPDLDLDRTHQNRDATFFASTIRIICDRWVDGIFFSLPGTVTISESRGGREENQDSDC